MKNECNYVQRRYYEDFLYSMTLNTPKVRVQGYKICNYLVVLVKLEKILV